MALANFPKVRWNPTSMELVFTVFNFVAPADSPLLQMRAMASETTAAARQSSMLYIINSRRSPSSKVSSQHRLKRMEALPEACGQAHSNPSHRAISFRLFEKVGK